MVRRLSIRPSVGTPPLLTFLSRFLLFPFFAFFPLVYSNSKNRTNQSILIPSIHLNPAYTPPPFPTAHNLFLHPALINYHIQHLPSIFFPFPNIPNYHYHDHLLHLALLRFHHIAIRFLDDIY